MAGLYCVGCCAVCLLTFVYACGASYVAELTPVFNKIYVINETLVVDLNSEVFSELFLEIEGHHLHENMKVRVTTDRTSCSEKHNYFGDDKFSVISSNSTRSFVTTKIKLVKGVSEIKFFACVKSVFRTSDNKSRSVKDILSTLAPTSDVKWVHQGESVVFRTKKEHVLQERSADSHSARSVVNIKLKT